jgi:hypothetical protein
MEAASHRRTPRELFVGATTVVPELLSRQTGGAGTIPPIPAKATEGPDSRQ